MLAQTTTSSSSLGDIVRSIVADGKGILAADERVDTLTKRFARHVIPSTFDIRREYREMFFTTPHVADFIGGVILHDETIRQTSKQGPSLIALLADRGIVPGIKVDEGAKPLSGAPGEVVTEGLDGLRRRLEEYRAMGARFAKWRAVISIGDGLPTRRCVHANADALARYAALCQERGVVPIVEPEVLMNGTHTIKRCEEVTAYVLHTVFHALYEQRVSLETMMLKPSMVVAGRDAPAPASVEEVATATLRTLLRHVPAAVPAIVFLSGGQDHRLATLHLNAMSQLARPKPWTLSFSYGRALQDEALEAWHGRTADVPAGQHAFYHRAKCERAAALGKYDEHMETEDPIVH